MALTRKLLKGMGLTEEQMDTVIEAHTETVDGLKAQIATYKTDAEKLPSVQKELDDMKAAGDGGYKDKYDKEHAAYEAYKADIAKKETKAAKEQAVRAYYQEKGITGDGLEIAMRGSNAEVEAVELEDGKIKDTKALDDLVGGTFKGLISTTTVTGANSATPPSNTGGGTKTNADIFKKDEKGRYVLSTAERQAAIAANLENSK